MKDCGDGEGLQNHTTTGVPYQGVGLLATDPHTPRHQPYIDNIAHSNGTKPVEGGGENVGYVGFGKSFELYTTRDEKVCPNPTYPTFGGGEDGDIAHSNGSKEQCRVEDGTEAPQPGGGVGLLAQDDGHSHHTDAQPFTCDIGDCNGQKSTSNGGGVQGVQAGAQLFYHAPLHVEKNSAPARTPCTSTTEEGEKTATESPKKAVKGCDGTEAPQPGGEQSPLFETPATATRLTAEHEQASSCLALWKSGKLGDAIAEIDELVYVVDVDGTKRSPGHATAIAVYYWIDRMAADIASAGTEWRQRDALAWLQARKEQKERM